jgi:hypothetical protein
LAVIARTLPPAACHAPVEAFLVDDDAQVLPVADRLGSVVSLEVEPDLGPLHRTDPGNGVDRITQRCRRPMRDPHDASDACLAGIEVGDQGLDCRALEECDQGGRGEHVDASVAERIGRRLPRHRRLGDPLLPHDSLVDRHEPLPLCEATG